MGKKSVKGRGSCSTDKCRIWGCANSQKTRKIKNFSVVNKAFHTLFTKTNSRKKAQKKAQITIFIIVGIILLFVFLAIISLSSKMKQGQLEEAQEKALTSLFKKEALRIYVQDCMMDELEKGLIILGRQGRIWSDQPGGRKAFDPGITGIMLNDEERVFYALTNEIYFEHPNAYPCNNETSSPEFCKYQYPDTQVGFGELQLSQREIERDLQRYLINRTVWCVENFTKGEVSTRAQVASGEIKLDLSMSNDGINVRVNYPLTLTLGKEELFQISKFDFFYPSKFKQLLDVAITYPLQYEQRYADFNYSEDVLKSPFFTYASEPEYFVEGYCLQEGKLGEKDLTKCKFPLNFEAYNSLGIEMKNYSLANGDTLFVFEPKPSMQIINSPQRYVYQFVRQNRPPALDYIHRLECPEFNSEYGYDYLVVKNDPKLGNINITASAKDADEEDNDKIQYSFSSNTFPNLKNTPLTNFGIEPELVNTMAEGFYDLAITAVDEHELGDWQEVRILVDRPLSVNVSLKMPYTADYQYKSESGDTYLVSREDPVFVDITLPEESKYARGETVKMEYVSPAGSSSLSEFNYKLSKKNFCIDLPSNEKAANEPADTCTVEDYNQEQFDKWQQFGKWQGIFDFALFSEVTPEDKPGKLKLSFSTNYCVREDSEGSTLGNSKEINVVVRECIPNNNPEFPYAAPYHTYKFATKVEGNNEGGINVTDKDKFLGIVGKTIKNEKEINPFLATHSCCNEKDWTVKAEGEICFTNPLPGCYGGIPDYTAVLSEFKGYVLEEQFATCDGARGNACLGGGESRLWDNKLICGSNSYEGCTKTNVKCQSSNSWSYVDTNGDEKYDGWCHGEMGCQKFCQKAVVNIKSSQKEIYPGEAAESIVSKSKPGAWPTTDEELGFGCGCRAGAQKDGGDDGRPCDDNYDGKFDKICKKGVCSLVTA
ncbi:MAG: hypothetical protein AB1668_02390 [Nanoarchaeota archaeon]